MAFNFLSAFVDNYANTDRYRNLTRQIFPPAVQIWGKKEAVWLDTGDAWRLFIDIPELRSVVNKRATMMSFRWRAQKRFSSSLGGPNRLAPSSPLAAPNAPGVRTGACIA